MDETVTYVGLYVHKETIAIALADARAFGQIVNTNGLYPHDGQALAARPDIEVLR